MDPSDGRNVRHLIDLMERNGWAVRAAVLKDGAVIGATRGREYREVRGGDLYVVACELAEQVGIDLRDG